LIGGATRRDDLPSSKIKHKKTLNFVMNLITVAFVLAALVALVVTDDQ
jgi:hypothetical protein